MSDKVRNTYKKVSKEIKILKKRDPNRNTGNEIYFN